MDQNRFKNNRQETVQRVPELLGKQKILRERRRDRRLRFFKILGGMLALILLFFFSPLFKISQIDLIGFSHADTAALRQTAAIQMGRHFLFVDGPALQEAIMADPYIRELAIKASASGRLTLTGTEYSRDYALVHEGEVILLDRHGRILNIGVILPEGVTRLVDDTLPLTPGSTMYGEGAKRKILTDFMDLMDQNTSMIRFDTLNITDPAGITLDHGLWTVELGDGSELKTKLNQAINILKTISVPDDSGIIDLKFDADPVIRPKGDS